MFFGMATLVATCGGLSRGGEQMFGAGGDRVGVIELLGPITETSEVVRHVRAFAERDKLEAIVVRIDSPGGAVAPSQELFDALRAAAIKKPIVVSMGNIAASGGLWVAMAGDYIFASPGTITGSLGVISQAPDFRKIADVLHLDMRTFKSGPHKDVGSPLRDMTAGDEKVFMDLIADIYEQFVEIVATRRNLSREAVLAFGDGRIMSGRSALEVGLVDEMGGLYAAADKAVRMARLRKASAEGRTLTEEERDEAVEPTLVYPKKPVPTLLEVLTQSVGERFADGMSRGFERAAHGAAERFLSGPARVELR